MRSYWIRVDPKFMRCVLVRDRKGTQRRQYEKGAEIGVMYLQAKEQQRLLTATRS